MSTKQRIVEILKSKENYFSGEQLSDMLGISRTAVWKTINSLKTDGYEFSSVTNKGYKIIHCPDIIDATVIKKGLINSERTVMVLDEAESTNTYAKSVNLKNGDIIIAKKQTHGRGRMGKTWSSDSSSLTMSVFINPSIEFDKVMIISLLFGYAVCEVMRDVFRLDAGIKWPNDIVVNNKKLAGLLTECVTQDNKISCVICGVGVNVGEAAFPDELKDIATSMYAETGELFSKNDVAAQIINYSDKYIKEPYKLPEGFADRCVNIGRAVTLLQNGKNTNGIAIGINSSGALIVETADGITEVSGGEVSVRGLYGYV